MNIAEARAQYPFLQNFTDQQVLDDYASQLGVKPGTKDYDSLQKDFLQYDRSWGDVAEDTGIQLAQGALGVGKTAASLVGGMVPGSSAYDNAGMQLFDAGIKGLDQYKSQGLQNMRAGAQMASDIAARDAAARGETGVALAGSEARQALANYWNTPALLAEDVVTNAPQFLVGGAAGKLVGGGLKLAGAGARLVNAGRVAGAVGAGAVMQGQQAAEQTYSDAIKAGATPERASELAQTVWMQSGGASAALSALPFTHAIEARLSGAATRGFGLGRVRQTLASAGAESASEAADEGYGQYATNKAVREVDPTRDLWQGVGANAVQGAAAAGPVAAWAGATGQRIQPRTEDGHIDLTKPSEDAPSPVPQGDGRHRSAPGVDVSFPPGFESRSPEEIAAAQRQNLDRPAVLRKEQQVLGPQQPAPTPAQEPPPVLQLPYNPTAFTDPSGVTSIGQMPTEEAVAQRKYPIQPADVPVSEPAVSGGISLVDAAGPVVNPVRRTPASFVDLVNGDGLPPDPFEVPPETRTVDRTVPTRGDLLRAIQQEKRAYTRKDGSLANNAGGIAMRQILEAQDPMAQIRSMYQNGGGNRDELLDNLHKRFTGQTIDEFNAAESQAKEQAAQARAATPDANSAGFVPEPIEDIKAQIKAVKAKRKPAIVLGTEEAARVNPSGLARTTVTDKKTGEAAVVMTRTKRELAPIQKRVDDVGLQQAMAEIEQLANPGLTTRPTNAPVAAVQQRDNATGAVLSEELVTPADLPNVKPIPGATAQVVPAGEPVARRRRAAARGLTGVNPEPVPAAEAPTKAPRLGREPVNRVIEMANTVKDEPTFNAAEDELFHRAVDFGDEQAENYFLDGMPPVRGKSGMNAYVTTPHGQELASRHAAAREAQGVKSGQDLGKAFGVTNLRSGWRPRIKNLDSTARKMTPQEVEAAAQEAVAALGKQGLSIHFGRTAEGFAGNPPPEVQGLVNSQGEVWVFTDNAISPRDVAETIFHELFHHGLKVWSRSNVQYTSRLLELARNDPELSAMAAEWKNSEDGQRELENFQARQPLRSGMTRKGPLTGDALANYEALAIEESLAKLAEAGPQSWPTRTARAVRNWVADLARQIGMKRLAQWLSVPSYEANKFVQGIMRMAGGKANDGTTARYSSGVRARSNAAATAETPAILRPVGEAFKQIAAYTAAQMKGKEISPTLLNMMSMHQIVEQFGKHLPAIREWAAARAERGAATDRIGTKANRIALRWSRASKNTAQVDALSDILYGASWSELQLDNTSAEYVSSLTPRDRAEYEALRRKLEALPPELQRIRRDVLDLEHENWANTRAAINTLLDHVISDPDERRVYAAKVNAQMGRNRGDYFPLSRFGNEVVIGKGAAADGGDIVTFHESVAAAEAQRQRLQKAGVKKIIMNKVTATDKSLRASTGLMGDLHTAIENSDAPQEAKEGLHQTLQMLYLKSLPELSGAKNMISRAKVEGFSRDALRTFADSASRAAHYAAGLAYAPRVQAAMESAKIQSHSSDTRTAAVVIGRKGDAAPVVQVVAPGTERYDAVTKLTQDGYTVSFHNTVPESVNEYVASHLPEYSDQQRAALKDRVAAVVGRTDDGVEDLRSAKSLYNHMIKMQQPDTAADGAVAKTTDFLGEVGYLWYLGFTPAFWMMNLMQNVTVGIPHLAGRYGLSKTVREIGRSAGWFSNVRMGKLINDAKEPFSIEWLRKQKLPGISKGALDMLQTLEDNQALDFTMARDLGRIGKNSNNAVTRGMRLAAAGAHHTEVFNRVVYALTEYNLALKSGANVTHAQAVQRALEGVRAVHLDYTAENSPRMMSNKATRPIFQFQKYRQGMLYWWGKTLKDSIKGESFEVRQAAIKSAALMALTQGTFAGALGMPFMGTVAFVANMVASLTGAEDDDGVPFDFERWLNKAARDVLGSDKAAEAVTRGVFTTMNMNIGQRIGQGDLLPFLNQGPEKYERTYSDKMKAMIVDALGPIGSIAVNIAGSVDAFSHGDVAGGIALATPKVAGDLARAWNLENKGITASNGDVLQAAENLATSDVLLQAVGISPTNVSRTKINRGAIYEVEQGLKDRAARLRNQFVDSWQHRDQEGMREALADIQAYNQKVAAGKLRAVPGALIDGRSLQSAIRQRQQKALILALTGGTADTKRRLMIALSMDGLLDGVTQQSMQEAAGGLPALPGLQ